MPSPDRATLPLASTADVDAEERRPALAVLLRRTPFDLLLPGQTIAGVRAAAPEAELGPNYRLRVRDDVLVLRHYGSGVWSPTWSVKARLVETGDGLRLEGHLRYLTDRLMTGMWCAFTLILLGVAVVLAVTRGPGAADVAGAGGAGLVMAAPTGFLLWLGPGVARRRSAHAKQLLRFAFRVD